ncbi:hypothetical protein V5799_008019 [Amblyomma americanum]|uniref:DM4 domain-containing protein n=1 Tax=Amblyomma americanum TaxID=6943 RepID=A0AAQ4FGB3_AMBAM
MSASSHHFLKPRPGYSVVCDYCGIDYPGDCPEHGPLTHVKDVEVEVVTRFMPTKPSPWALSISRSTIKRAQHGVFTLKPLPRKVYFGPHEGVKVENNGEGNGYNWQALQTQVFFRTIEAVVRELVFAPCDSCLMVIKEYIFAQWLYCHHI